MLYPDELWRGLESYLALTTRPIIAIDGPAGSGKTTLSLAVENSLTSQNRSSTTVHMDDLYDGWESALASGLTDRLKRLIASHHQGLALEIPQFNWSENRFDEPLLREPSDCLILEGVGSGQRAVRDHKPFLIWIESESITGLSRVLEREPYLSEDVMRRWQIQEANHFSADETKVAANIKHST